MSGIDFSDYKSRLGTIRFGKRLPDALYVHQCALPQLDESLQTLTKEAAAAHGIADNAWNVVKYFTRDFKLTLLHYPDFFDAAYPTLYYSYTIDLLKQSMRKADYSKSDNPPILHRKELFLPPGHADIERFAAITVEGEAIGLYENSRNIGFKKQWERLISQKGYALDDAGRLQAKADLTPVVNDISIDEVARHKTAIDRYSLSRPMQILARHGYLDGDFSVLDYGCGKGDDLRELEAHGLDCEGWDPVYRADGSRDRRDIVNLGFVLNVIEDRAERTDTLQRAWQCAEKLLIVSVMIAGDATISRFRPYKDGVLTSRNTFQKYYV